MITDSNVRSLKPGDCVQIIGRHLQDVLLVTTMSGVPSGNKIAGQLLSTSEQVRIVFVKNHSGFAHMRRSSGEVIHLEMVGEPLNEESLKGLVDTEQARMDQETRNSKARAAAFKRNCKVFERERVKLKT